MIKDLYKEGYTQNRELSWLQFDMRCLNEAKDKTVPDIERLKFVEIYTSNLTEFFMVRVGSLYDMDKASVTKVDNKSGLSPKGQLNAIYPAAKRGLKKRDVIFEELRKRLARAGIEDIPVSECDKNEVKYLRKYFRRSIAPLLAPQIVDTHHPFPNLQFGTIYIAAVLKYAKRSVFAFVPVPTTLPAIISLPHKKKVRFVHTEDLIMSYAPEIFPDAQITEIMKISVARSAYVDADDDIFANILDYRKKMLRVLKERRKMNVTMLTFSKKPSDHLKKYLQSNLGITNREVFVCSVPMNLKYVYSLPSLLNDEQKEALTYPSYEPKLSPSLNYSRKIFPQIQKKDVLLSYPYESMEPFLQLLKESASDPNVVSIKITIYRLASHARLVDYLCLAAENGKEVDVLIELKARFDEQNNIDYSERLEDAGCNVIYGFEKYKVHSKICLITRVEKGKTTHAALLSTGNFNENTAKLYTDLAYMTSRPEIIDDAIAFFQNMAIGKLDGTYNELLVAPVSLKSSLLAMIDEQIAKGEEGYIFAKVNSVTDEEIIVKLKEASCAGVQITLLVRGICCLVPGVKGKTENIEVRQIVGRYLEHSRIYIFGKNEEEKMYISSADFMTRNTERRVEIACPLKDAACAARIHRMIDLYMADNTKVRGLFPTGRYHKIRDVEVPVSAQEMRMEKTAASNQSLPPAAVVQRPAAVVFDTTYKPKKKKKKKNDSD